MSTFRRNFPGAIGAVIFDFDETMIDLEEQHTYADAELCRQMGSDHSKMPESFRFSSGRRIVDNIREMRSFFGWKEEEGALFAVRQRHFDRACASSGLELMPGVARVVRGLHEGGMPMAITTSAVRSGIEAVLRRFDLLECFGLIVDGSEVMLGKPHPEAYEVTARRLAVPPDACVVFEDSHVGVEAAKRAGMFCVAVRNPTARLAQDLSGADVELDSFEDLDVRTLLLRRR